MPTWSVTPPTLRRDSPYEDAYQVTLGWTGANESGIEYKIYRDGVLARTVAFPFGLVSGLRPQTTYTLKVEACFAGGNCTTDGPTLVYRTAADTTPLDLQTADVLGEAMTLRFNDPLDDTSVPATSDFTVTLNGAAVLVSGVVVHSDAKELLLTLAEPAYAGDMVLLSYVPGAAPIRDFGAQHGWSFERPRCEQRFLCSRQRHRNRRGQQRLRGWALRRRGEVWRPRTRFCRAWRRLHCKAETPPACGSGCARWETSVGMRPMPLPWTQTMCISQEHSLAKLRSVRKPGCQWRGGPVRCETRPGWQLGLGVTRGRRAACRSVYQHSGRRIQWTAICRGRERHGSR